MATPTLTDTNDAPTLGFYQGFEAGDAGILDGGNGWHGNVAIHNSGDGGITTVDGSKYAVFTQSDDTGPFSRFDGYRSDFVEGLTSEVKVYLDTSWTSGEGFDYSVAATGANGSHLRDFIFHVAKDSSTGQLLVGASNNTNFDPRQDLHSEIPASGWFTLQHVFHNVDGHLSVDLNLLDAAGNVVFTQTIPTTDLISDVGGNRYGWFTNIDVAGGIAVDAISLGDLAGNLTETADLTGSAVARTVTGEIPFLDADLSDSHTVSATPAGSAYVGQLTATVANQTAGDGEGVVRWTFSVNDAAIDFLAEGETRTQTYAITVNDGHGGTATQDVTITLTGTNDAPTLGFYQGFEAGDAGILDGGNGWHGNVAIHNSGDGGITTVDGSKYAVFTQSDDTGPFSRFDGYRSDFVEGLTSEVKVYLDTSWTNGEGFDYSVAATGANGSHLRDFIFHVAKDSSTGQLLVGASNNTNFDPRQDLHSEIPASGWFTLQHVFHNVGGHLSVDLNLLDAAGNVVFTQTIPTTDLISDVGGNRYGWFTNIDVAGGIAVDAISLGDLAGNLTETADLTGSAVARTVTGEIPFLDADLSDSHTVSATPAGSAYVGQLTATVANQTAGDGEGVVRWTFSVNDAAIDFLAEGETRTQTYTITVNDGHGGTATQDVTITLTGTNDAPTLGFYQGFEAGDAGILDGGNGWHGNVAIHNSGDGGITTVDGSKYAVFTQSDDTGPFSRFDGYRSDFVEGLTSEVKVYLDTSWTNGEGFDYSVAATGANGSHLRDFIFHVAKDSSTGQLLVGASNNTNFDPRQDLHSEIPASGWFTLQHVFHNVDGHLSVDLNLLDAAGNVVFTQTIPTTDLISDVGGNRYGWFTNIDVAGGIAVDAISLGDLAGNLTETADLTGSAVARTVTGEIPFLDADLSDSHTVSATPAGSAYVGQLTATVANQTAGDGEGVVRWTFSVNDAAIDFLAEGETRTQTYTITVNDGHGGTATQDVTITLTGTNDAPVVDGAIANQLASEDRVWSFQVPASAFSDVDGDTLTYTASLADGSLLPAWLTFNAATRTFSGTPPLNFNGPFDLKVAASDGSTSASDTFTLTILPVNDAPVLTAEASGSVTEDVNVGAVSGNLTASGALSFTDADVNDTHTIAYLFNNNATWTAGALTAAQIASITSGFSADANGWDYSVSNAALDFLGAGETITLSFTVEVKDSSGISDHVDTEVVTITINGTNDAPVVNEIANQSASEDHIWSYQVPANAFSDVDGDTLTYTASLADGSLLPVWLTFNAATRTFSGTPPLDFNGPLDLKVTASDGSLSTSDTFKLSITPEPVITSNGGGNTAAVSIAENTTAVTIVTGIDPDVAQALNYSIIGGADASQFTIGFSTGALSFVTAPNFELPTDAGSNNVYDVIVQASNGHGGIGSQAIAVTVQNVAEEVSNGGSFNFKLTDATVSFSGNHVIVDGPSGSYTVPTDIATYVFTDGTVNNTDGAPLVDDLFYYSHNHDVWNAHVDADQHYHQSGWREGRDPNPYFDTSWYLATNPDVRASGANPLTHYQTVGWHEGRDPGPNFDTKFYLMHNPDVAAAGVDPLAHYLQSGFAEGRAIHSAIGNPVNGFDAAYYLEHNPDVAAAGIDPLAHFNSFGWHEGRDPNAMFDTKGYLAHYADVANAGVNPLAHYEQSGWKEGRDPSAHFDTTDYLAANPDVAAAHVNPLDHYLTNGIYEGRTVVNDGLWG